LLDETLFISLDHGREALSLWKDDYDTIRPHSGLGNLTPVAYANAPNMQRNGRCAQPGASRPLPLHRRANRT
jgi:putative transposase